MASHSSILRGKRILVTRPRRQAAPLADALKRLGATVVVAPAIRTAAPASWGRLDRSLRDLEGYDALIFTSSNAVESFFARAGRVLGSTPRRPGRLYAIGPATARALERFGWSGVRVPEAHEGAALARFPGNVRGRRILIPQARAARDALARILARRGARVDVVEAYRTLPDRIGLRAIRGAVREGAADAVTFTSPSTAERFVGAVGAARARTFFGRTLAVSIGPVTSRTLRGLGVRRILEADPYTTQGVVHAIAKAARAGKL